MSIEFIIYFFVLALASNGLSKLYLYLIQQNELFSFMQPALQFFATRNDFIWRSIGGCNICTTQRFADVTYILLTLLFWNGWIYCIIFYFLFSGLSFYFSELTNKSIGPIVNHQKLDLK